MSVTTALRLSWRYLTFYWGRAVTLVLALALTIYLPLAVDILVQTGEQKLRQRADTSPLLLGGRGSRTDLVVNSLYFERRNIPTIPYGDFDELAQRADQPPFLPIPLVTGFAANDFSVVGTSLDYFEARSLPFSKGGPFAVLGDCVLGAEVARELRVGLGDAVISTPENAFNLGGDYPLKMRVRGILAATGTPDDRAIFVDVKTHWVIAGLAHGHQDLSEADADASGVILHRKKNVAVANDALVTYNEITPENIGSFHFHGDQATFPLTAVLVFPESDRAGSILEGEIETDSKTLMAVRPSAIIGSILGRVLEVQAVLGVIYTAVCAAMLLLIALVLFLSARLRAVEFDTLARLGFSRWSIAGVLACELGIIIAAALALAWLGAVATTLFASELFLLLVL